MVLSVVVSSSLGLWCFRWLGVVAEAVVATAMVAIEIISKAISAPITESFDCIFGQHSNPDCFRCGPWVG